MKYRIGDVVKLPNYPEFLIEEINTYLGFTQYVGHYPTTKIKDAWHVSVPDKYGELANWYLAVREFDSDLEQLLKE
jgi:hypothetical protein